MKIPLSSAKLFRSRLHSLQWFAALVAGSAITLILALMPLPGIRGLAGPVHAFSKQTRQAGASTFREKGCEHCHGIDGIGTDRGPNLSGVGKRWDKARIEKQIREGGGGMPAFGDVLQSDEIKNLVDYLSAKRKSTRNEPKPPMPVKPASDDSGF